jgi:tetratricopeptide (TPR) repeat protein
MSYSADIPDADRPRRTELPWFGELDELDFEIDFFEQILRRQPNYLNVLRVIGELLSRKGLYDRTLEIDRRLVSLRPSDGIARYNLACSLARQGDLLLAVGELSNALELGYDDFAHLEVDPDLDALRELPEFLALIRRYGVEKE